MPKMRRRGDARRDLLRRVRRTPAHCAAAHPGVCAIRAASPAPADTPFLANTTCDPAPAGTTTASLKSGKIEGRTPLRKELEFSAPSPGCYTLTAEVKTPGGSFRDTLLFVVKAPKGGFDGVKDFWESQGK